MSAMPPRSRATSARHARGRPRRADVDAAILAATIDLLVETRRGRVLDGPHWPSVPASARRRSTAAGRRREELILEALETAVAPLPDPDTGSLRRDLQTYVESLVERVGSAPRNDVLPHLLEASCYDDQLRASLEGYVRDRQSTVRTILEAGHHTRRAPSRC